MRRDGHPHFRHGVGIACGLAIGAALLAAVGLALTYDGHCGGYFPGLAGPHPCSRWQYLAGDGPAIALVMGVSDWPLLLLLALPPAIGWWLDRRV